MDNIRRIPIRVMHPAEPRAETESPRRAGAHPEESRSWELPSEERLPMAAEPGPPEPVAAAAQPAGSEPGEMEEWRDRALRLQAEMDNYRKLQQRIAQDQIESERRRLLRGFLSVIDNLERALEAPEGDGQGLRQGVELTHRAARQFLEAEGVEMIEAENRAFDPEWHEAVATVSHDGAGSDRNRVVRVLEPGYRLEGRLLRPARVIVAV